MAIENLPNESGESHLSGAYIRTLVKQLTTTTPTSKPYSNTTQNFTYNNNDTLSLVPNYNNTNTMTNTTTKKQAMAKSNHNHNQDQTHGHKKQVRRRLHTSRPYQERLLNMAEARKEIVTALKFHRAAMKQANDRKQQQQQQQQQQSNNNQQQVARDYNNYDNCGRKVKSEQLSVDNILSYQYQPLHNDRNYNQNYYSSPSNIISTTPMYDSLNNIPLPNQTLGLNLNLQAFTNLDTNFCHNNNMNTFSTSSNTTTTTTTTNPSMVASPSSPSTPVSITTSSTATEGVGPTISGDSSNNNNNMHPCLDEDEIAKMKSIGEQYQVEWDDTLNLVKSAWWFKFLKTVDFGKDSFYNNSNNKNDHDIPFEDELMEFPPWLSPTNDESFLHQQLDDSCSEDNTTLPWMDIEDIDGMDDEWLS